MLSDELKLARKRTIAAWNRLKILDSGSKPTAPPKLIYHPRAFDKSMACKLGQHKWETRQWRWSEWYYGTVPILWCRKCGEFRFKGIHEGTETPKEMRYRHTPSKLDKHELLDSILAVQRDQLHAKK